MEAPALPELPVIEGQVIDDQQCFKDSDAREIEKYIRICQRYPAEVCQQQLNRQVEVDHLDATADRIELAAAQQFNIPPWLLGVTVLGTVLVAGAGGFMLGFMLAGKTP